ncbi:PEP-CTERM sorting domain-containing protein [Nostoc parmelioides]|uniref:PEP-CTERM sorting domain-containing protein n=1 Tax=Nostoc parmelioides TaxID=1521621 RepID=UPI0030D5416D
MYIRKSFTISAIIINVPEPNSILSLIALGTLGAGSVLKHNQRFKLSLKQLKKIS